jgi:hypothetical protein
MPEMFKQYALPGEEQLVKCNRPFDTTTIPLALLHEAFGNFRDERDSFEPQAEENSFVESLRFEMTKFFKTEDERLRKFHECFGRYYSIRLQSTTIGGTKATTDGHAFEKDSATSKWIILMTEAKNELAGSETDPRFQAILYYRTQVQTYETSMFGTCCFPAIIITYYGM